ncbi:FMN-dependent NADH-azoreductase [Sporobacter termitidis DSM 10068]|uniref:FMN dependent NADH:quinone oxidoreductase n=1 Tax=Sporobacter termitidis DSM 10068 TaxID=1123282 RepID=A0A1M5WHG2_9FIRM|nr:NAD(P)H-dependent oxidoreductase [Sporobacter termitidis]SHH86989.1 FMN-dependent NADH-azoreductase [Sporobacter termitidis DSM 10068]
MSQLLYIFANPKPRGESRTLRISDGFVGAYRDSHPQDTVIELDLYKENIGFLTQESLLMHNVEPGTGRDHPQLKYAYQFLESDKIVIAAPFWNLSFPAILKAYLDYVTVSGITFKYTSQGPVGQCQGKKAVHIVTRGGAYGQEPLKSLELGDRYLKTLFQFLGFQEFTTIAAENMDRSSTDVEAAVQSAIADAQQKAKDF